MVYYEKVAYLVIWFWTQLCYTHHVTYLGQLVASCKVDLLNAFHD